MKISILTSLLVIALVSTPTLLQAQQRRRTPVEVISNPAKTYCDPDPNQIAVFVDAFFEGGCNVFGIGDYLHHGELLCSGRGGRGAGAGGDCISSILVGANVHALLCSDENFSGVCEIFTANAEDFTTHPVGNDAVSSARVVKRDAPIEVSPCIPNSDQVVLFEHANFQGSCVVLERGEYPNAIAIGLSNDSTSSIKVGANVIGILCSDDAEHQGFFFFCARYIEDDRDVHRSNPPDFEPWVSSAKIRFR